MLGRPVLGRWALFEPGLFGGRPCDLSGCASSANPSERAPRRYPARRLFIAPLLQCGVGWGDPAHRALFGDREAQRLGFRELPGGGRCDQQRVAPEWQLLRGGDASLKEDLVQAGVAGEGQRSARDRARAGGFAAVLVGRGDALALDLAPAHLLGEGEADVCLPVERERDGCAERQPLVLTPFITSSTICRDLGSNQPYRERSGALRSPQNCGVRDVVRDTATHWRTAPRSMPAATGAGQRRPASWPAYPPRQLRGERQMCAEVCEGTRAPDPFRYELPILSIP